MKPAAPMDALGRRRAYGLAALIVVNVLCVVFFVVDVVRDFESLTDGSGPHLAFEALAAFSLMVATVLFLFELRRILESQTAMTITLRAARGEMAGVIDGFFGEWKLTDAEKEVGMLILKGFDNEAIGIIRGTAAGTVRAQSTSIYAKAGVEGRPQFMSVFMEELMSEPLVEAPGTPRAAARAN